MTDPLRHDVWLSIEDSLLLLTSSPRKYITERIHENALHGKLLLRPAIAVILPSDIHGMIADHSTLEPRTCLRIYKEPKQRLQCTFDQDWRPPHLTVQRIESRQH